MDSELGIALKFGHPCYFVMFYPQPLPGQTIESVCSAEIQFMRKLQELHPDPDNKPFVIGNCQGGWALMMLASLAPDLVGPILLAGSPISYWAGVGGINPMRYSGGLLGGTWLPRSSATSAQEVRRRVSRQQLREPESLEHLLEQALQPLLQSRHRAAALSRIREMVGRPLPPQQGGDGVDRAEPLRRQQARRRRGRVVRRQAPRRHPQHPLADHGTASWGDNITPPQQALNWIPDLYRSVEEIRLNNQTIVYCLHEKIGHLGIFVSASVAKKETHELASALELIDTLPPGLYEAVITDTHPEMPGLELVEGRYLIQFQPRTIDDILKLDDGRGDERAFEVVNRVSQINQGLYDTFLSPV